VQNSFCAKWAAMMLNNWIGDEGWIERIGRDIMTKPPGYPESVIPSMPKKLMPELFDRYPFFG
jgi:hypothetical protein